MLSKELFEVRWKYVIMRMLYCHVGAFSQSKLGFTFFFCCLPDDKSVFFFFGISIDQVYLSVLLRLCTIIFQ
jgi:hypothetical protein